MLGFQELRAALPVTLALAGCADLAGVQTGVCGNGVVESGEDCDQKDSTTSGNACGQPGQTGACQFICAHGGSIKCPEGFACGVDDLCRKPVNPMTWTAADPVAEGPAQSIVAADFDGDGLDDAVTVTSAGVLVHYFDTTRTSTTSASIASYGTLPAVGALAAAAKSTDTTFYPPSVALLVSAGLGVFTGGADRTLTPIPYASLTIDKGRVHATPFLQDLDPSMVPPGAPPVLTDFFIYQVDPTTDKGVQIFTLPSTITSFITYAGGDARAGVGVVGTFDAGQACQQLAMAFNGPAGAHVGVWSPCGADPSTKFADVIALGTTACTGTCQSLHLVDMDFDGNVDLVLTDTSYQIHVAYSNGKGGFSGDPLGPFTANAAFGPVMGIAPASAPLAFGDLNGDCTVDWVDATGIHVSVGPQKAKGGCAHLASLPVPTSYVSYTAPPTGREWSEAHIVDINADGLPDVVVGSSSYPDITVYRGTGTALFDPLTIPTDAPVKTIALGDFDGDLVPDLVFAQIGPPIMGATATQDTVYLAFGTRTGPLATPVPIGQINGVEEIVAAAEQAFYKDLIESPFVSAYDDTGGAMETDVYLFGGSGARQIDAPYFLLQNDVSNLDVPVRSVVGSFTGRTGSSGELLRDVAVYARPSFCSGAGCTIESHLWLLEPAENASIEAANQLPAPNKLSDAFGTSADALLANLGPASTGQHDQLVMAVPGTNETVLMTPTIQSGSSGDLFASGAEAHVSGFELVSAGAAADDVSEAQILAAQMDGKGPLDLVLGSVTSGVVVVLWDGTTFTQQPIVTYDTIVGTCPGGSSAGNKSWLSLAALKPDAALGLGTSQQQKLVAAVPNGVVLMTYDAGTLTPSCLATDNGVLSAAGDVQMLPGMQLPAGMKAITGGSAVGVGDFNGDGIQDFIVSEQGGLVVYYGDAQPPGGSTSSSSQALVGGAK